MSVLLFATEKTTTYLFIDVTAQSASEFSRICRNHKVHLWRGNCWTDTICEYLVGQEGRR